MNMEKMEASLSHCGGRATDRRKKRNHVDKVVFGILLACIAPFLTIIIMAVMPLDPIDIHGIKILNPDRVVTAGSHIIYAVDATKHTNKPARILRQLVNDRTTHYTPIESNIPVGRKIRTSTLITSTGDPPGEYYIQYTLVYRYFGFRDVSVSKDSEPFMIVEK